MRTNSVRFWFSYNQISFGFRTYDFEGRGSGPFLAPPPPNSFLIYLPFVIRAASCKVPLRFMTVDLAAAVPALLPLRTLCILQLRKTIYAAGRLVGEHTLYSDLQTKLCLFSDLIRLLKVLLKEKTVKHCVGAL